MELFRNFIPRVDDRSERAPLLHHSLYVDACIYMFVCLCVCVFNFFQPIVTAIPNYSHRVESPVLKYFDRITGCDISGSFSLFGKFYQ